MGFKKRAYQKELLDGKDIPFADIEQNMAELEIINRYLGGHSITVKGFSQLAGELSEITVCEIGCGGGDNLAAIARWCRARKIRLNLIGIDQNEHCISIARLNSEIKGAQFYTSDYLAVHFETQKPHIIFSSLFCHHFSESELLIMLRWMQSNATTGFFINDLHRHPLAWFSIKWLTRFFSRSYLVKHDAPLSVKRGFKRGEWKQIFARSGIERYSLSWKWAFRWLIVCPLNKTYGEN